jgi:hypothetical protein
MMDEGGRMKALIETVTGICLHPSSFIVLETRGHSSFLSTWRSAPRMTDETILTKPLLIEWAKELSAQVTNIITADAFDSIGFASWQDSLEQFQTAVKDSHRSNENGPLKPSTLEGRLKSLWARAIQLKADDTLESSAVEAFEKELVRFEMSVKDKLTANEIAMLEALWELS